MHSPTESSESAPPVQPLGRQAKLVVGLLAAGALLALFWPRGDGTFKEPGGFLYDAGGQAMTLGPRLAPVSLVHFWATWCPPCLEEIPALQRLGHDFAEHRNFAVVMIAVDDSAEKVRSFLGPGAGETLFDPDWDVANRYGTEKLPETYLVVGGRVVEKFVGQTNWDDPEIREKLTARLSS
jgi:thiol-disulfide isomerase/thioredoxin